MPAGQAVESDAQKLQIADIVKLRQIKVRCRLGDLPANGADALCLVGIGSAFRD